jgi:hypothetical protein
MRRASLILLAVLVLPACGSGGNSTTVTTTVSQTVTVAAPPPTTDGSATQPATPTTEKPSFDPDDVEGQLDIRDLNAKRTGDLLAVSLTTYEPWSSNVLVGPAPNQAGLNRLVILYDVNLDGVPDYRGKIVFVGGTLSLYITGQGQAFEPVPVERPTNMTAQYAHPADVLFPSGSSKKDIQIQARSFYNGQQDKAPDDGMWLGVPYNP